MENNKFSSKNLLQMEPNGFKTVSEILATHIIEKVLSYVFTDIKRKIVDSYIPDYCYEYTENLIRDTLSFEFIFHDINNKTKKFSKGIYLNNEYYGEDDWSMLIEPINPIIDRHASTTINVQKSINSMKPYEEIIEIKDISKNENVDNVNKVVDQKKQRRKTVIMPQKTIKDRNSINVNAPQVDLNRKDLFEDDEEIIKVRNTKFEEWKRIEEEAKKKIKGEREFAELAAEIQKKNKEYTNKLVTADSSGSIIYIKPMTNERLINDFLFTRSVINEKPQEKEQKPTQTNEEKRVKKSSLQNELDTSINKQFQKKNSNQQNEFNIVQMKTVKNDQKKKVVGINPPDKPLEINNKETRLVMNPPNNTLPPSQVSSIQPMGSNFDYMVPDVGVTIYEGMKTKSGGKNFSSIFKKPSKYDYTSLVKETTKNTYVGLTKFDNSEETNQIINRDNIIKMSATLPKLSLMKTNDRKSLQNSLSEMITVNSQLTVSLKTVLDKLDIMTNVEKQINETRVDFRNKDYFKNMTKNSVVEEKENIKDKISGDLDEINKFNYSIVNDRSWGNVNGNVATRSKNKSIDFLLTKFPVKPNKRIFEKELGKNIVETKLPRSRMYSFAKNIKNSNHSSLVNSSNSSFLPTIYK